MFGDPAPSFVATAAVLLALTVVALAWPFLRGRGAAASRAEHDMEAYRAQLRELDTDLARGIVTEADAETARLEISRRLLAADARRAGETAAEAAPQAARAALLAGTALAVPALAIAIYMGIGAPGYPDFPLAERQAQEERRLANRPSQEQAEAQAQAGTPASQAAASPEQREFEALLARLEERLQATPDDPRGLVLLARSTARLGRYDESWRAYARLIAVTERPEATLYADMAEAMVMAANGYVSPEAESALDAALDAQPDDPQTRYYKALALAQRGKLREAYERWQALYAQTPAGAEYAPLVYERLRQAAEELGEPAPEPPAPAAPGPDAEDMAAAAQMMPEDRMAMIEGMVARLAERLEDEPDDLEGWLRLLRAYRVLGREDALRGAAATARETFEGDVPALARIDAALQ